MLGWKLATKAFLTVSLPLAVPGLVASALLVFLYSLDEFTGTLLVGAPFVTTLPVYMYTASQGYEMQIASVTALVLTVVAAFVPAVAAAALPAGGITATSANVTFTATSTETGNPASKSAIRATCETTDGL